MTEPKEPVSDVTEPIPAVDDEATRAEAEAAAQAADEIGGEDETLVEADEQPADDGGPESADDADLEDEGGAEALEGEDIEDDEEADEIDEVEDATSPVLAGAATEPLVGAAALAGRKTRGAAPATAPVPEPAIRVNDRASKIFVILTVLVFGALFLNAMLLGTGGTFRPYVTPSPEPSVEESLAPSPSESLAPSGSPVASGSPGTSASPAASGSVAPSGSPATSGSPAPS